MLSGHRNFNFSLSTVAILRLTHHLAPLRGNRIPTCVSLFLESGAAGHLARCSDDLGCYTVKVERVCSTRYHIKVVAIATLAHGAGTNASRQIVLNLCANAFVEWSWLR